MDLLKYLNATIVIAGFILFVILFVYFIAWTVGYWSFSEIIINLKLKRNGYLTIHDGKVILEYEMIDDLKRFNLLKRNYYFNKVLNKFFVYSLYTSGRFKTERLTSFKLKNGHISSKEDINWLGLMFDRSDPLK